MGSRKITLNIRNMAYFLVQISDTFMWITYACITYLTVFVSRTAGVILFLNTIFLNNYFAILVIIKHSFLY